MEEIMQISNSFQLLGVLHDKNIGGSNDLPDAGDQTPNPNLI